MEIVFPKLKAARGVEDPALQEQIKSIREMCIRDSLKVGRQYVKDLVKDKIVNVLGSDHKV